LAQSETERLLTERLASFDIAVERAVELTCFVQTSDSVSATLRHNDGREETVATPWLIGCDGAHSTTRHILGMDFEGAQYDESFILADVQLESALARDRVHLFLSEDGVLGAIPFARNRWRVVANIPPDSRDQTLPEVTLAEAQALIDQRLHLSPLEPPMDACAVVAYRPTSAQVDHVLPRRSEDLRSRPRSDELAHGERTVHSKHQKRKDGSRRDG
jgi:2-polyprenyl-6-methoxyphenol hydroxylase-like FAD-dependent oxidoreductase